MSQLYSVEKPIPVDPTMPEGLVYKYKLEPLETPSLKIYLKVLLL